MKLLTSRDGNATQLHVEGGDGWVSLHGFEDVGQLLRVGSTGLAAAAEAARSGVVGMSIDDLQPAPPVTTPRAIVCVGRNYVEHALEGGEDVPSIPILFPKFCNALIGSGEPILYPAIISELDYEGELCVVIGRRAQHVKREDALAYVGGYTIMHDVSARDLQLGDVQSTRGKSLDSFAPTGPYVVTPNDVGEIADLQLETRVNGVVRQSASCADMVFDVPKLIEFITEGITLEPGDLIATGTPAGTGIGSKPPTYLAVGDIVEISITNLGSLRNPVVAA